MLAGIALAWTASSAEGTARPIITWTVSLVIGGALAILLGVRPSYWLSLSQQRGSRVLRLLHAPSFVALSAAIFLGLPAGLMLLVFASAFIATIETVEALRRCAHDPVAQGSLNDPSQRSSKERD